MSRSKSKHGKAKRPTNPDVATVRWTHAEAFAAMTAVSALPPSSVREATLARFESAHVTSDRTIARFKAKQLDLLATALRHCASVDAVAALAAAERDVLEHAETARRERKPEPPHPQAQLSNMKASQRSTRARHLDGRSRPER